MMRTIILFQDRRIPVYLYDKNNKKKAMEHLMTVLNRKIRTGRETLKKCLNSLISIEISGSEAVLHAIQEKDSLTISLF